MDVDDFDEEILSARVKEDPCTCGSKVHQIDCPMNTRKLYSKRLFKRYEPGDRVVVHIPKMEGKHLICRICRINDGKYTLYYNKGTLLQRFAASQLQECREQGDAIPLDKWRLSNTISVRDVQEEDVVDCCCRQSEPDYVNVSSDEGGDQHSIDDNSITNHLYTLSSQDLNTIQRQHGWLNDSVISASQMLLKQHFPHIGGLQPPSLQLVRGFDVHRNKFLQILNVDRIHWCVVSNIGCNQEELNVYDTMYTDVQLSIVPIIAGLVFSAKPTLTIRMIDVNPQGNTWDCGVLAIAIAYDLCCGNNPAVVRYDSKHIRPHLVECLKQCMFTRFPLQGKRQSQGVISSKEVELFCTCRMPEEKDNTIDPMAECDDCREWYHRSCMNIPDKVFGKKEVPWRCKKCTVTG